MRHSFLLTVVFLGSTWAPMACGDEPGTSASGPGSGGVGADASSGGDGGGSTSGDGGGGANGTGAGTASTSGESTSGPGGDGPGGDGPGGAGTTGAGGSGTAGGGGEAPAGSGGSGGEGPAEVCDNGIDDDGDGWADCRDVACFSDTCSVPCVSDIATPYTQLQGCTDVTGDVGLIAVLVDFEILGNLRTVTGRVVASSITNPSMTLERLAIVGSLDVTSNGSLASLDLPRLTTVGGLTVVGDPSLASLSLPQLTASTDPAQPFSVAVPAGLEVVAIPSLISVAGDFQLSEVLAGASLPALTSARSVTLYQVGGTFDFPSLESAGETIYILEAADVTIDLPSMSRADDLTVAECTGPLTIDMPAWTESAAGGTAGFVTVAFNTGPLAIAAQSLTTLGELRLSNNTGDVDVDLSALDSLAVGGDSSGELRIENNTGEVSGTLGALEASFVRVNSNDLTSLALLGSLASTTGLHVRSNPNLLDLTVLGLSSLGATDGPGGGSCAEVEITGNARLANLALAAESFDASLQIFDNGCLPSATAEQVVDDLLAVSVTPGLCPCNSCLQGNNGSSCN